MNTLTLDGWVKPEGAKRSSRVGLIHFRISDNCHQQLEMAEESLQSQQEGEALVDIDLSDMELETSQDCGQLSDCQLRVYLNPKDERGHFHLIGHRASDGSLIYTNSVMVDQLG